MNCPKCGAPVQPGKAFCENCGASLTQSAPAPAEAPQRPISIPSAYKPLSPWAYLGWSLVYSIPILGLVFLIVNSFRKSNLNRRNYARSYWCAILVVLIIFAVIFGIAVATGQTDELMQILQQYAQQAQSGMPY